jgi:peptidylprolyl isomerase
MLALLLVLQLTVPTDLLKPPPGHTRVITPGGGDATPKAGDFVRLRFVAWDLDGKIVDKVNGETAWTIVDTLDMYDEWRGDVLKMHVGEQRRTWVPAKYIVLDTELLQIIPRPETPPDVAAPPKDAIVTPSGLAYKILHEGYGKTHPKPGDHVFVHYSGWTTDGKLFDSSVVKGAALDLPVAGGIAGWTEGIQLMTAGTKARFWMPPKLAYAGVPDKPQGMVVFDVELFTSSSDEMPKRGKRKPGVGPAIPAAPPLPPGVH